MEVGDGGMYAIGRSRIGCRRRRLSGVGRARCPWVRYMLLHVGLGEWH